MKRLYGYDKDMDENSCHSNLAGLVTSPQVPVLVPVPVPVQNPNSEEKIELNSEQGYIYDLELEHHDDEVQDKEDIHTEETGTSTNTDIDADTSTGTESSSVTDTGILIDRLSIPPSHANKTFSELFHHLYTKCGMISFAVYRTSSVNANGGDIGNIDEDGYDYSGPAGMGFSVVCPDPQMLLLESDFIFVFRQRQG